MIELYIFDNAEIKTQTVTDEDGNQWEEPNLNESQVCAIVTDVNYDACIKQAEKTYSFNDYTYSFAKP